MLEFTKSVAVGMPTDRLKVWLDFWKFLFVSGLVAAAVAIVPPWINGQIQNKELGIKAKEQATKLDIAKAKAKALIDSETLKQELDYVKTYIKRGTSFNVEDRFIFTRYLAALTRDAGFKTGWEALYADAKRERDAKKVELKIKEKRLAESAPQTKQALKVAKIEIERLKSELTSSRNNLQVDEVRFHPTTLQPATIEKQYSCPAGSDIVLVPTVQWRPHSSLSNSRLSISGGINRYCLSKDRGLVGNVISKFGNSEIRVREIEQRLDKELLAGAVNVIDLKNGILKQIPRRIINGLSAEERQTLRNLIGKK